MRNEELSELTTLMSKLTAEAVGVQQRFDAEFKAAWEDFKRLCKATPSEFRPLLAAQAPRRTLLQEMRVTCRIRVAVEHTTAVGFRVQPLNLGHELRFGRSQTHDHTMELVVEQTPWPEALVPRT